jgi:sialic acid synthase
MIRDEIRVGDRVISSKGPAFVIAEIGHNHQGNLETAIEMVEAAADCGADAVKLQKRFNHKLYTQQMYDRPYENENSYGATYGEHRDALEFDLDQYKILRDRAEKLGVEFLATPFDFDAVDFLEELGVACYKIASGDMTSLPLLQYVAKKGKPMFISTGASTFDEVKRTYDFMAPLNVPFALLHCVANYPVEHKDLNLKVITKFLDSFPKATIGYSSHENGILSPVLSYMLGAQVIEAHFTLNRAWKGTDHKFSLEPGGFRKMVRDLRRVDLALGNGEKMFLETEKSAREKMGKSLYYAENLPEGTVVTRECFVLKSPGKHMSPFEIDSLVGTTLKRPVKFEDPVERADLSL